LSRDDPSDQSSLDVDHGDRVLYESYVNACVGGVWVCWGIITVYQYLLALLPLFGKKDDTKLLNLMGRTSSHESSLSLSPFIVAILLFVDDCRLEESFILLHLLKLLH
jgi:hypothetical protein